MEDTTITNKSLSEFSAELAEKIEKTFFDDYGLSVMAASHPVMKTNGERQGITVKFDGNTVAPTVYVEEAYQKFVDGEVTIPELVNKLCDSVYEAQKNCPQMPELTPEEAKKHITLTLVNTAHNQQLLSETPHWDILGGELSAIPRWYIDENASFVVKDHLCSQIGLTSEEVLQIGQKNINAQRFEVKTMQEVLAEMMGPDFADMMPPMDGPQMIVLTSENKIQGANSLLSESTLNEVHEKLGSDFVVLPSSIHEVICVPITDDMDPEDLKTMVRDINAGQVAPEERLSDEIFVKHEGQKLAVVRDSLKPEAPKPEAPIVDGHKIHMAM